MKLLAVAPLNTRPNYYLIRVDSRWNNSNYDDEPTIGDNIEDIEEAIEEQMGPCDWEDDSGKQHHDPWPAPSFDSGCSWWDATDHLPKRLRPKAA